jgi:uncharacterized protein (DUF3084 family)
MAEWPSLIAAVFSGIVAAGMAFYIWGRRVERRAAEASQRLVLAANENLHKSLDQKLAGVDRRDQDLRKLDQQLQDRTKSLSQREQEIGKRLEQVAGLTA